MAVVKMGQIKTTLARSIQYITQPSKTDGGQLVLSNFTSDPTRYEAVAASMMNDLDASPRGLRAGGVLAHHVIQSFDPEDPITPGEALRMGQEFVQRITDGEHKYVIATHVDKNHVHNHIIICAANEVTHKKMRIQKNTLKKWRGISDELCRDAGIRVLRKPDESRVGRSMGEIYASAKGIGIKERIRNQIDVAAANTTSFSTFGKALEARGIKVTVRGQHLTFVDSVSGQKIRDTRLGQAYDQLNIMARISKKQLVEISFNEKLIVKRTRQTVTIALPGTRRSKWLAIPTDRLIRSGKTLRAFLGTDSEQVITDRNGRYTAKLRGEDLYEYFSRPDIELGGFGEEKLGVTIGVSDAQKRFYRSQGHRLDELRESARQLTAIRTWAPDGNLDLAIERLSTRIRVERADLQAQVVSLSETLRDSLGDAEQVKSINQDIDLREVRITSLEKDMGSLEKLRAKENPQPERGPRRTRHRSL
jgi:hypothetical protein